MLSLHSAGESLAMIQQKQYWLPSEASFSRGSSESKSARVLVHMHSTRFEIDVHHRLLCSDNTLTILHVRYCHSCASPPGRFARSIPQSRVIWH